MNTLTLINHNLHETTDSQNFQNFQNFHNLWIQGFTDPRIYGFKVHEIYEIMMLKLQIFLYLNYGF